MALSLCIGLLIDDAIVVRENIVRHLALGKDHVTAAREGTDEIGLAVMATTFAIVAVFVPIAFMNGIIGRFFFQFGVTVTVAVLVSLFVSFTLDPMLSSVWRDPPAQRFTRVPWLGRQMMRIERAIDSVHVVYAKVLRWALGHRKTVLAAAVATFLGSFLIVPLVGTEFIPDVDQGFISLRLNTPVGSSLEYTDAKAAEAERVLAKFPEIALVMTTVGTEDGRNYARVNLKLVDRSRRSRSQKELERAIRAALKPIPGLATCAGLRLSDLVQPAGPGSRHAVTSRAAVLRPGRQAARHRRPRDLRQGGQPGAVDPARQRCGSRSGHHRAAGRRDGPAARCRGHGELLARSRRPELRGQRPAVEESPAACLRPRQPVPDDQPARSRRADADGSAAPGRRLVESTSPQIIKRQSLQRRVGIYANVQGRPSGDVGSDVQKIADTMQLPPGYRLHAAGQQQDMQESFQAALAALGLAIIFIYLILASQFASFTQPLAIMASLPFSLIGVLLALLLTGTTLNLFSIIGFIMLMGLVTKNAILLVDFANRARRAATLADALLTAGQVRLRPILMTTAAMIGGMLPLALGLGDSGEHAGADGSRDHRRRHHLDPADAGRRAGALHLSRRAARAAGAPQRRARSAALTRLRRAPTTDFAARQAVADDADDVLFLPSVDAAVGVHLPVPGRAGARSTESAEQGPHPNGKVTLIQCPAVIHGGGGAEQ